MQKYFQYFTNYDCYLMTGTYSCKVATFFTELRSRHQVIIFDPGLGPSLSYVSDHSSTMIQCRVEQVFPEPVLQLAVISDAGQGELK